MKRHYGNVRKRKRGLQHEEMGLSEVSGLQPLCEKNQKGIFSVMSRVTSVRAAVLLHLSYCMENKEGVDFCFYYLGSHKETFVSGSDISADTFHFYI